MSFENTLPTDVKSASPQVWDLVSRGVFSADGLQVDHCKITSEDVGPPRTRMEISDLFLDHAHAGLGKWIQDPIHFDLSAHGTIVDGETTKLQSTLELANVTNTSHCTVHIDLDQSGGPVFATDPNTYDCCPFFDTHALETPWSL